MKRRIFRLSFSLLLLLPATQAYADKTFFVSPLLGNASISNISGYGNAAFLRIDGSFFPVPQFGVGAFVAGYQDFKPNSGSNGAAIKVNGYGVGITGRWPVSPHMQPYARLDYMFWNAEAKGLGLSVAKQNGGSPGIALGVQVPVWRMLGVRAEVSAYNKVSDANLRQFSIGWVFEF
jgi:Outer membrane protein beta-barrel domain